MLILLLCYEPLESKYANRLETFDEVCILCLSYIAMCFTDFVPDPEARYDIGLYYIGINSLMILVHLVLILYSTLKSLRLVYKKY